MTPEDNRFLRDFFRAVGDRPLDFLNGTAERSYVPLYEDAALAERDPVRLLARAIEWTPGESVQLFSGFRGCGKSTELRRLRAYLTAKGYKVVLFDVEDYLGMSQAVDIVDFLMAVAGAFGDGLVEAGHLKQDPTHEGYWIRAVNFLLRTNVDVSELAIAGNVGGAAKLDAGNQATAQASAGMKLSLKTDPSFRERLRNWLAGHLGALVADVRDYVQDCTRRVKQQHGEATEIVLIVDSMEHIRGTSANAKDVQDSVERLFGGHADKLHLPFVHVVYTVPPYLKVLCPGIGGLYAPGGVQILPAVKLREHDSGAAFAPGLDLFERVISARGDWRRLLGNNRAQLDDISYFSGGQVRDFLRLFAEIMRSAEGTPVPAAKVDAAVQRIRTEFLPIADADVSWLARIAATHEPSLPEEKRLPDLARFLDTHMVLCYQNGAEWYDVQPLVADLVSKQAKTIAARGAQGK